MAKKSFTGGLNSLLGEALTQVEEVLKEQPAEQIKPTSAMLKTTTNKVRKEPKNEHQNSSKSGTKENETRATFIINEELLENLKAIAYWERKTIKEVLNNALSTAVAKYENKNGKIIPMPNKSS